MKILALDIGAGTEDVLFYDDDKKNIENCIKLVLPSPSKVFASKVRKATMLNNDLFIKGDTIGGGAFAYALIKHVKTGYGVFMTESAAYSIRNDLDEIEGLGIEVIHESKLEDFKGETLMIEEVNIRKIQHFLEPFGETFSDIDFVAIAVQDHGVFPKGMSNRRFRIERLKELLERNARPEVFAFMEEEIPQYYLRMKSAALASKRQLPNAKVLVMDTSPNAIIGCLEDPIVKNSDPTLVVNVGNGHTMAAIISNREIVAILEHHTGLLNPQKLWSILVRFADGKLTDGEIFEDKGHGLFFLAKPPSFSQIKKVVATGPKRNILAQANFPVHFATPAGDMMMTGPIGLVEATKRKLICT